ncbi:cardiolipin synthase [Desulfoscipio gibsoniae]|uniref:Cardiolipin synthase n=1 Tax=Desulfoscipio gibsoniae DSM 7213 TaxID=767817 RepID=R4KC98_9FIRM|nr:cardiolipin synthase [Desulfoscipio gibsoniae]AGL00194.1 phosphatidylserine/phosphatidylglycerophosphate/cardiolipin synthase [Desulfoscipio gibsoniae DSM 7213]
MKKLFNFIFNRMTMVVIAIIAQISFLVVFVWKLNDYFIYMQGLFWVLSTLLVLKIINSRSNPIYKIAIIIPILILPILGTLLYFVLGNNKPMKRFKERIMKEFMKISGLLAQDRKIIDELEGLDKNIANQSKYILNTSLFPIYKNTTTQYLSPGEVMFEKLKEELGKAKHYIFMEFFILEEGLMWDSILDILVQKVGEGVEVRVMYDDVGSIYLLPSGFNQKLTGLGIQCVAFNPVSPVLSLRMNNRDHRKIVVIDGRVAFTGGINLADEYINAYRKYGHWKDSAIMIKGDAAWSFTVMFLHLWNATRPMDTDYTKYMVFNRDRLSCASDGYVQPYADMPLDEHLVAENIYLNIINKAKDYVYINTPYLIADNEIVTALCLAAQNGVDVRIITPYYPDKWYIHPVTRSYYPQLIEAGVKIYEYTPGFMHAKTFVADDELATVGSPNLDFRSLYLHFECGVWLYKSKAVSQLKEDFLSTLKVCIQIQAENCVAVKWSTRFLQIILRIFSPLL